MKLLHLMAARRKNNDMKKILAILIMVLIGLPVIVLAHTLTKEDSVAVKARREQEYRQNRARVKVVHEKYMAFLKEELVKNKKLTEVQKSEILAFSDNQHKKNDTFLDSQHKEDVTFFDKLNADITLTADQRKVAVKAFFKKQRENVGMHHRQRRLENREEIKRIQLYIKNNSVKKTSE
jgi:hypothetical protein